MRIIRNIINCERNIVIERFGDKLNFKKNFNNFFKNHPNYKGSIKNNELSIEKLKYVIDDHLLEGFNPSKYCKFNGALIENEGKLKVTGKLEFRPFLIFMQVGLILIGLIYFFYHGYYMEHMKGLRTLGTMVLFVLIINLHMTFIKIMYQVYIKYWIKKNTVPNSKS